MAIHSTNDIALPLSSVFYGNMFPDNRWRLNASRSAMIVSQEVNLAYPIPYLGKSISDINRLSISASVPTDTKLIVGLIRRDLSVTRSANIVSLQSIASDQGVRNITGFRFLAGYDPSVEHLLYLRPVIAISGLNLYIYGINIGINSVPEGEAREEVKVIDESLLDYVPELISER